MLQNINKILEKWMPFITPISVVVGVLMAERLVPYTFIVPWIFALMTFVGSLSLNFNDLKRVIMHPVPILICILVLHLVMPTIAWVIGNLLFSGDAYTITGLVLAFTIPTGIISFMWVSIYQGNIAMTLSIILISTLVSPFVVPQILSLFVGAEVHIDVWGMMSGLLLMLGLPSIIGLIWNQATEGRVKDYLAKPLAPLPKIGLGVVVAINSSVVAPVFRNINLKLIEIALTVLLIAILGYLLGWWVAKLMRWERGVIFALTINSGMRNISAGAVLALSYFPPPVAVPVIVGMLFQQILASTFGKVLEHYYSREEEQQVPITVHAK